MGRLQGKVALVTGGSKGIGKAIVERFAKEGAKVVFTAIEKEAGEALEKELIPNRLVFMQQDVSKKDDWDRIINATISKFGKINIIVNNAGIGVFSDIEKMTEKNWNATIGVNLTGTMWGVKYGIQAMKNNHEKNSIINLCSVEGLIGDPDLLAYNASKGGVRLLTKSAALHCARENYDIRINSVHPGYVDTPLVENLEKTDPKVKNHLVSLHPMGRLAKPVEVANMALFLASDESSFSTGSEFLVDGGYTAQ
ncbi:2,5-dichloro-2,5-cyclohexadiene-1,4-diol dehydrogenase [Levilactobacillus zymae]|uniref:2,5-dichloro-2,5-cyclohexadiene-1,4-diol dehydrogenase n=1 Tax=Levilactobacillus zymae TaxID=267363 RepID=A0ABQ0X036_9LACO|nr:glucose 1-dehydrogenase [Levilactobacillus zymae]KRL07413.1 short-chain dehydrogenase reductase SDR [Levilactobacillus zymae DSM 19395]QFR60525.1 glucose 1-dehydrogenase [Levilactobacillus zymae]GEO71877.1 2,5-dichloro-2,5-cyclohexadiene-1,4-diol dehydrogenase [Levilactobacillus zymae]